MFCPLGSVAYQDAAGFREPLLEARMVTAVGQLLLTHPEIPEIDINPLVLAGEGRRPVALDALIVPD